MVSRIKNSNAGWLNTVSNAASSAAGKVSIPSGAVSAVFHRSMASDTLNAHLNVQALEYLLVYTPSGHLVQYNLLPSMAAETSETVSVPAPSTQIQEDGLRVKVEPIRWWDVCRGSDWPEREEYLSGKNLSGQEASRLSLENSDYEHDDVANNNYIKCNEQCHFSNAEVQINSGRIPIWQKPEVSTVVSNINIYVAPFYPSSFMHMFIQSTSSPSLFLLFNFQVSFFTMSHLEAEQILRDGHQTNGEIEIENIPVIEVEIRQKNLFPVFNHFHGIHFTWDDR